MPPSYLYFRRNILNHPGGTVAWNRQSNGSGVLDWGDAVIVAAETAVMASSRVSVQIEGHPLNGKVVKAAELAGINAATFRRNDVTGALEVLRTGRNIDFAKKLEDGEDILNSDLHKN